MTNKPKAIGTAAETAVVRYAQGHGFPLAERRALAGAYDVGDVLLTAFCIVEVKGGHAAEAASDLLIEGWLAETETERRNAGAMVGLLVTKRKGVGPANAGRWWAHWRLGHLAEVRGYPADLRAEIADDAVVRMTLADALVQLRAGGYGDPLPVRENGPEERDNTHPGPDRGAPLERATATVPHRTHPTGGPADASTSWTDATATNLHPNPAPLRAAGVSETEETNR